MYDFGNIEWKIRFDKECLRKECSDNLSSLTLKDREIAFYLEDTDFSAKEIFTLYNNRTKKDLNDIESNSVANETRNCLTKVVKLNYPKSEEMFAKLVNIRRRQILDEFMGRLNSTELCKIDNFSADKFTKLITRYCNFKRSLEISDKYGLTLFDDKLSKKEQRKARRQIKKEQKLDTKNNKKHMKIIITEIDKLVNSDDIFRQIIDNNLDTMTILGLKQDWQRKLASVKPTSLKIKQVFDMTTRKYIESVVANYSKSHTSQTLQDLRILENDIADIIMTIFDLDNTRCNNLIHISYEYKKLCDDKHDLELIQKNRQNFLGKN